MPTLANTIYLLHTQPPALWLHTTPLSLSSLFFPFSPFLRGPALTIVGGAATYGRGRLLGPPCFFRSIFYSSAEAVTTASRLMSSSSCGFLFLLGCKPARSRSTASFLERKLLKKENVAPGTCTAPSGPGAGHWSLHRPLHFCFLEFGEKIMPLCSAPGSSNSTNPYVQEYHLYEKLGRFFVRRGNKAVKPRRGTASRLFGSKNFFC
jgi:hypothetical protein